MTKETLKEMVANNLLEEVIKELLKITKNDHDTYEQVVALSASFNSFKKEEINGELDSREQEQQRSRIVARLLKIIKGLPGEADTHIEPLNPPHTPPAVPTPNPNATRLIAGTIGLILTGVAVWWFAFREIPTNFHTMVVNLHGQGGITDHPIKSGSLSITGIDVNFKDQASINNDGEAVFESIPLHLAGKKIACFLDSITGFQLKEAKNEFTIADKINVKIEKNPPPTRTEPRSDITSVSIVNNPCKTTSPNGEPIDNKVYKPHEKKLNHQWTPGKWVKINGECVWKEGTSQKLIIRTVNECPSGPYEEDKGARRRGYYWEPGKYVVKNGECKWIAGEWKMNDTRSCPTNPPPNVREPAPNSNPGYLWKKGYYIKENGQCIWIPGEWTRHTPTYVPPPRPATHPSGN